MIQSVSLFTLLNHIPVQMCVACDFHFVKSYFCSSQFTIITVIHKICAGQKFMLGQSNTLPYGKVQTWGQKWPTLTIHCIEWCSQSDVRLLITRMYSTFTSYILLGFVLLLSVFVCVLLGWCVLCLCMCVRVRRGDFGH